MGVVFIKTIHKKHGFTLVELIVVLSILAILATLLIPPLTGYIEKAKKQAVLTFGQSSLRSSPDFFCLRDRKSVV